MPVMVVLPAIAGFAGAAVATAGFTVGVMGMSMLATAVVAGAICGAVVGGIGAAITGGDIGDGILFGAVGGAVGGFLGGMYGPALFGGEGVASSNVTAANSYIVPGAGQAAAPTTAGFSTPVGTAAGNAAAGAGTPVVAGKGMSDMAQYALLSGGADMLKGDPEVPYSATEGAQASAITAAKEKSAAEIAAQERIAKLDADTSMANQATAAATTREGYSSQERQAAEAIAQRKLELVTPIEQAALARDRSRETASGLTLARKQAAGTIDPFAESVG